MLSRHLLERFDVLLRYVANVISLCMQERTQSHRNTRHGEHLDGSAKAR